MENILFINACVRSEDISRTYRLCKAFLDRYKIIHPDTTVTEIVLAGSGLSPLTQSDVEKRSALILAGDYSDPMFDHAKQFANADKIIIGAPLWDLSFPSILKVYIEHICANTVTFTYENDMPVGLSKFSKLLYISTCGGFVGEKDYGKEYIIGIGEFLGHGEFMSLTVQGLDIAGTDIEAIMTGAEEKSARLAEVF